MTHPVPHHSMTMSGSTHYIIPCNNGSYVFQSENLYEDSYCEISESTALSYMYVYAYNELFLNTHRRVNVKIHKHVLVLRK